MILYTPRGLKIRLPIPYVFALIKRLYPERSAYQVLTTAEAVDEIPSFLCNVALLTALFTKASFWGTISASTIAVLLGKVIIWNGLFLIPGLPTMALIWSYLPPSFLRMPFIAILGFVLAGWTGLWAVLLAYLMVTVLGEAASLLFGKLRSKPGFIVTESEMCFFDAYNLHASAVGAITKNVGVSDEELEESNWILPFMEYIGGLSDQVRQMMGVEKEGESDG
ncbi:MAG TPA: hypothetical protein GXX51_11875 [Firmicutes bacterium]|nr:hypothetical protein [Bacillota bacterium]